MNPWLNALVLCASVVTVATWAWRGEARHASPWAFDLVVSGWILSRFLGTTRNAHVRRAGFFLISALGSLAFTEAERGSLLSRELLVPLRGLVDGLGFAAGVSLGSLAKLPADALNSNWVTRRAPAFGYLSFVSAWYFSGLIAPWLTEGFSDAMVFTHDQLGQYVLLAGCLAMGVYGLAIKVGRWATLWLTLSMLSLGVLPGDFALRSMYHAVSLLGLTLLAYFAVPPEDLCVGTGQAEG